MKFSKRGGRKKENVMGKGEMGKKKMFFSLHPF